MKKFLFAFVFTISILNSIAQDWTWIHGGTLINTFGFYGTLGVSSPTTIPGTRHGTANWIDASGNLWLFGGEGLGASGFSGWLSDLWKYDQTTKQWTWIKGTTVTNQNGIYGSLGVSAPTNNPGGREFATSWTDASGNFWMYGGDGYAATGGFGRLGDLWKYNPGTNEWTWVNGPNAINQNGNYGTMGVSAPTNVPGSRYTHAAWKDASGDLWLFGGLGFGASGGSGELNDLWKYSIGTNEWTWINGSTVIDQNGIYGTMGVSSPTNNPGGRDFAVTWKDAGGDVFLFGGNGMPLSGTVGYLSDMWRYNAGSNTWTWVNGPSAKDQNGVYGTIGITSGATNPGGRFTNMRWVDPLGNFWVYGGFGFPATGTFGNLNDLFKYNSVTNQWTWMKGSNISNQYGTYGTQGTPAPANTPGARYYSTIWQDNGNAWMWGGFSFPVSGAPGNMNELWRFQFPCNPESTTMPSNLSICSGNNAILTAVNGGIGTTTWYSSPTSTTVLGSGSNYTTSIFTTTTPVTFTFYAEVNTCTISPVRTPITVTVNALPIVTASSSNTMLCLGQVATLTATGAANYNWNPGALNGSSVSVSPTITTTYSVFGIDANGCSDTTNITQSVSTCIGITPLSSLQENTSIFPNPNKGRFYVNTETIYNETFICIFNLLGQEVLKQSLNSKENVIDLSDLNKSVYLYRIVLSDKIISTGKIIVE